MTTEPILAALTALVAALVWLVKSMNTRSDRLIEQRDKEVNRLIGTLERAVDNSASSFGQIDQRLQGLATSTETVLSEVRSINARLPQEPAA